MMFLTPDENAIKHGIDPLQQGGEIHVRALASDGVLDVGVADTGQGLSPSSGMGIGIQNICERLQTLFGKSARLELEENIPRGMLARIRIEQETENARNAHRSVRR